MLTLGIMDSHLSSAALIRDGEVLAAVREEALNRQKGYARFPRRAVEAVLRLGGVSGSDVEGLAFGIQSDLFDTPRFQESERGLKRNGVAALSLILPPSVLRSERLVDAWTASVGRRRQQSLLREHGSFLRDLGLRPEQALYPPHHLCHAATALALTGSSEPRLIVVCDGYGDGRAGGAWLWDGQRLRKHSSLSFLDSLGSIYSRVTRVMGLKPWEHEYKVMGLAPYGQSPHGEALFERLSTVLKLRGGHPHNRTRLTGIFMERHLARLLAGARFDHIAYAVQKLHETVLTAWIAALMDETGINDVACAGGCFLNVKANQRIAALPALSSLFIVPPSGDESASLGAALVAWAQRVGWSQALKASPALSHLYWGPDIDDDLEVAVEAAVSKGFHVQRAIDIEGDVAELLAQGEIVARATGRAEFGPRALGNRSILSPADDLKAARRLNTQIKRRDFWMPFAASIRAEDAGRYVINPRGHDLRFMILTTEVTPEGEDALAAAMHPADQTTRPQVVDAQANPGFHRLMSRYEALTGSGALLNTSLNRHGEPMVATSMDAVLTFEHSALEHLALGPFLLHKASAKRPRR